MSNNVNLVEHYQEILQNMAKYEVSITKKSVSNIEASKFKGIQADFGINLLN